MAKADEGAAGRYRIQAVSKLTGVPAPTLRAWERRYGVPAPMRTASSYRLYDEHAVEVIRRMRDLVASGMGASEAAQAVLAAVPERPSAPADPYEATAARIVDATRRFDPDGLDEAARACFTLGPAPLVYDRAIAPALRTIGELWHAGDISVAQEHLASERMQSVMRDLLRLVQPVDPERTALLACFEEESHNLGLLGAALRFASWGYRTVVLGARTPPGALGHAIGWLEPDVVGLSVVIPPPPARARELVDLYADACRETVWVVGGEGATQLSRFIEGRGGLVAAEGEEAQLKQRIERAVRERALAGRSAG